MLPHATQPAPSAQPPKKHPNRLLILVLVPVCILVVWCVIMFAPTSSSAGPTAALSDDASTVSRKEAGKRMAAEVARLVREEVARSKNGIDAMHTELQEMRAELEEAKKLAGGEQVDHAGSAQSSGEQAEDDTGSQARDDGQSRPCVWLGGVGVHDGGGGGAFMITDRKARGKNVFFRGRNEVQGGNRWMFLDAYGQWVVTNNEDDIEASRGILLSDAAPWPHIASFWKAYDGTAQEWMPVPGLAAVEHKLAGCADRPDVRLPVELKALLTKDAVAKSGVDYLADYDITQLVDQQARYAYPKPPRPVAFHYPGDIRAAGTVQVPFVKLSDTPKVFYFPRFLTDEECDAVINAATPRLKRSTVGQNEGSSRASVSDTRTSRNAWLSEDIPAARVVMERVLGVTGMPHGGHEHLQVLRYGHGQEYRVHADYVTGAGAETDNRAATFFLYLSTVEEGGWTSWPQANGRKSDFKACKTGLRTVPQKGSAVLFYDMRPDWSFDEFTMHAGCPVEKGTKWGGTYWLHLPNEGYPQSMLGAS